MSSGSALGNKSQNRNGAGAAVADHGIVMPQPAGSSLMPSSRVRSVKMFWNVKYSFSAGRQSLRGMFGSASSPLISDANARYEPPSW